MKISLSENRKSEGNHILRPAGTLRPTGLLKLRPAGTLKLKPIRRGREREREIIRYQNAIIPNYLYKAYPIHRQFVIEKEVTNQNDYSNFFIIIIIILIVSSILIYSKI
jgi:hypothetical protein